MGLISVPCVDAEFTDSIWRKRYESLYAYVKRTYADDYVDGAEYGMMNQYNEDQDWCGHTPT